MEGKLGLLNSGVLEVLEASCDSLLTPVRGLESVRYRTRGNSRCVGEVYMRIRSCGGSRKGRSHK